MKIPIVSSGDGYWLGTPSEVRECAKRLRVRAAHQFKTARALRRFRLFAVTDMPAEEQFEAIPFRLDPLHHLLHLCLHLGELPLQ